MEHETFDRDWCYLLRFCPADLDALAKQTGAVRRWRNVRSGEELLRLALAYTAEDYSLRSTAGWADEALTTALKDTSVLHRLRHAPHFLEAVLAHLLSQRLTPQPASGGVLRLVDATVLSVPGSCGTDWRIHAVYDPVQARLTSMQLTDHKGGESLTRGGFGRGDLVLADRGLAHARGLHAVAAKEAHSLVRMHWQNIRLLGADGSKLVLDDVLRRAEAGESGTVVYVPLPGHSSLPARLLIAPLPPTEAEKARARLIRNASKKQRQSSALALRLAGYFCLLTTLPEKMAANDAVLEFYRVRWQIELFFKRCKGLLGLGDLRADDPPLVQCYCLAKLILIALDQLLASEGEAFSPWGVPRRRTPAAVAAQSDALASDRGASGRVPGAPAGRADCTATGGRRAGRPARRKAPSPGRRQIDRASRSGGAQSTPE